MNQIYTLSNRTTKDVLKSIFVNLKEKYLIDHDVMDDDSRIELLENIVDLEIILERWSD